MPSSTTTQVELHTIDTIIAITNKFNNFTNTSNGRDKFSKVLQNGARVFGHHLSEYVSRHQSSNDDKSMDRLDFMKTVIKKTNSFESNLSMARKVFRFGKFTSGYISLYNLLKKMIPIYQHYKQNGVLDLNVARISLVELLTTLQRFVMANFFFMDMFNWAAKIGLLYSTPLPKQRPWYSLQSYAPRYLLNNHRAADYSNYGNYIWFTGVCLLLSVDAINFVNSYQNESAMLQQMYEQVTSYTMNTIKQAPTDNGIIISGEDQIKIDKTEEMKQKLQKVYEERDKQYVTCARNICDMGIAASLVGFYDLSKGSNGLLGLLSALIGSYEAWPAK